MCAHAYHLWHVTKFIQRDDRMNRFCTTGMYYTVCLHCLSVIRVVHGATRLLLCTRTCAQLFTTPSYRHNIVGTIRGASMVDSIHGHTGAQRNHVWANMPCSAFQSHKANCHYTCYKAAVTEQEWVDYYYMHTSTYDIKGHRYEHVHAVVTSGRCLL